MCSKRKPNGSGTIALVERAATKVGQGIERFFVRAGQLAGQQNELPLLEAAYNFDIVARQGAVALPGYEVPSYVVRLAEEIDTHRGDPKTFFKNLKA